jgi:pimeloyl-ACP methyl ester carboxylesterase
MDNKHDFWHMYSPKTFSTISLADSQHPPLAQENSMNNILSTLNHAALIGLLSIGAVNAQAENKISKTLIAKYPPLGQMVDIGGRKMQLDCRGSGNPTVVFEAGLDNLGSLSWTLVHDAIAQTTRACVYSRAGIMWSDPQDTHQNGKAIAEDLHTLLNKAGEQAPFVLVGHSLGGPYSMTYTKYFGAEVAGLVFVDASHPDQEPLLKALFTAPQSKSIPPITAKLKRKPKSAIALSDGQIAQLYQAHAAYLASSELAEAKEYNALTQTLAEAGTFRQLGSRPIFVLTATAPLSEEQLTAEGMTVEQDQKRLVIWKQLQADMATWSSNSQQQYVTDSTHLYSIQSPRLGYSSGAVSG